MTSSWDLVCKYFTELNAKTLPDGSLHPDDLSEARFMAELEQLESGELEPDEHARVLSNVEAMKLNLQLHFKFGGAALESTLKRLARAEDLLRSLQQNAPVNPGRLPPVEKLQQLLADHCASGLSQSAAIQAIATEYVTTTAAVYKKFQRASIKLRK